MNSRYVSQISLMKNMELVAWVRTVMTIIGGALIGILGVQGLWGFLSFAILHVLVSLALVARIGNPSDYFPDTTTLSFVTGGAGENLLLFIVFWALGFGTLWVF
jgi:hypothetical protein